jgi:hypothetical protein
MASVNFDLKLATAGFQQSLSQASNSVNSFSKTATDSLDKVDTSSNDLSKTMSGSLKGSISGIGLTMFAANIATSAFQASMRFLSDTITGSISAYAGSEEALNKLKQSMNLTGTYSEAASKQVEQFATALEASSKFADDAIVTQVAYARSLGLSTDQSEKLVQAAANMSAQFGGSLEENVAILGKTLDGTIGRLGKQITGTDQLGKSIKGLTEEQLKAGGAADYINARFNGAAAADLNTYAGKVAYMKNQYDNLQESIGSVIVNSGVFQSAMEITKNAIINTTKWIESHTSQLNDLGLTIKITSALAAIAGASYGIYAGYIAITTSGLTLVTAAQWAWNLAMNANPIVLIITGVVALGAAIYGLIRYWDDLKLATLNMTASVLSSLLPLEKAFNALFHTDVSVVSSGLKSIGKDVDDLTKKIQEKNKAQAAPITTTVATASKTDGSGTVDLGAQKAINANIIIEHKSMIAQKTLISQQGAQSLIDIENAANNDQINTSIANSTLSLEEKQTAYQTQLEIRIAQQQEELIANQALEDAKVQQTLDAELAKATLLTDSTEKKKAFAAANDKAELARVTNASKQQTDALSLSTKQQKELQTKAASDKKDIDAQKTALEAGYQTAASGFITAGMAWAKKGSATYKHLAIADATVSTYLAASKAMATIPAPANFAVAASIIAGGLVNVGKITSVGDYANGGFIGGSSFQGDNLQANVNSGEAVLNTSQQKEFMKIANGGNNNNSLLDAIHSLGDRIMNMEIKLIADDTEIARSTSRGVMNGIQIGSSR